jgi:hypothetical protein
VLRPNEEHFSLISAGYINTQLLLERTCVGLETAISAQLARKRTLAPVRFGSKGPIRRYARSRAKSCHSRRRFHRDGQRDMSAQ